MFERQLGETDVRRALETGKIIEEYTDDKPYRSFWVLEYVGNRPLHVVIATNEADRETIVIPVYEPDSTLWKDGFTKRRFIERILTIE